MAVPIKNAPAMPLSPSRPNKWPSHNPPAAVILLGLVETDPGWPATEQRARVVDAELGSGGLAAAGAHQAVHALPRIVRVCMRWACRGKEGPWAGRPWPRA